METMATSEKKTRHEIMMAWVLVIAGILAYFVSLFMNGEPGTGTLAFIGECFTLAGALMGIVSYTKMYVNRRLKPLERAAGIAHEEDEHSE